MNKRKLFAFLFWIFIWEIFVFLKADPDYFPSFFTILSRAAFLLFSSDYMIKQFFPSTMRLAVSAIIVVPVAVGLSLACVGNKYLSILMNSFVSFSYPLPKVALFPLYLIVFGMGDLSKIVLISTGMFYLVFMNTYEGMRVVADSEFAEVAFVYKIKRFDYWYNFLFRGSLVHFILGLKSGLGYGLTLVVVSEFSMSRSGLGYFIWSSWDQFRVLDMYSGIFILALAGYAIAFLCDCFLKNTKKA